MNLLGSASTLAGEYIQDLMGDVLINLFGATFAGVPTVQLGKGLYVLAKGIVLTTSIVYCALKVPGWVNDRARVKEKLVRAFIEAQLYVEKKRRDIGDGGIKPYRLFPTIERVNVEKHCTTINMRLPIGMEPDTFERGLWVFQNTFGPTAKLINDTGGRFRLVIPKALPAKIQFNQERAREVVQRAGGLWAYIGEAYDAAVAVNLQETPHIGVVGVTGWGKSTGLRCLLNSWLQVHSPNQLRLFLGDLKMTEFGMYRGVPHVEGSIAVRRAEVVAMLSEVQEVLNYRQERFHDAGATDLIEYAEITGETLPYVIVCIDEVASLEGETAAHEVLEEIGQLGRSFGIFLVLSQQRVDREVMDGKLKNNINVRIGYRMSDEMNSKMFLGTNDAASINTKGRCFVKESTELREVQTPWLSPKEAREQIEAVKKRYAGVKKEPLLPPINPTVPQPVELTEHESDELRELVRELMGDQEVAACATVTKRS